MGDHLSPDKLARYRQRALTPEELLEVTNHLAVCADCRALAAKHSERGAAERLTHAVLGEAVHLTDLELELLASHEASEAETARAGRHLDQCDRCRLALDDLRLTQAAIDLGSREPVRAQRRPAKMSAWNTVLAVPVAVLALFVGIHYGSRDAARQTAALKRDLETAQRQVAAAHESVGRAERRALDAQATASAAQSRVRSADAAAQRLRQEIADIRASMKQAAHSMSPTTIAMASDPDRAMAEVLRSVGQLGEPGVRTRGGDGLLHPVREAVVSRTPTLKWSDHATDYGHQVEVILAEKVVASRKTAPGVDEWGVTPPLTRGRVYVWRVKRLSNTGEAIPWESGTAGTSFRVLDPDEATAVLNARILAAMEAARIGLISEARDDLLQAALDGADLPISDRARTLADAITRASYQKGQEGPNNLRRKTP